MHTSDEIIEQGRRKSYRNSWSFSLCRILQIHEKVSTTNRDLCNTLSALIREKKEKKKPDDYPCRIFLAL